MWSIVYSQYVPTEDKSIRCRCLRYWLIRNAVVCMFSFLVVRFGFASEGSFYTYIYIYIYIYIYTGSAKKMYTHFNERNLYVV